MIGWVMAVYAVGFVTGLWMGKIWFGRRADEKLSTEECVEHLKEKGYGVHLYGQNKDEKRGFR